MPSSVFCSDGSIILPVRKPVPPQNMMSFHKPVQIRKNLLTDTPGWCIIYRMFVFGRSLSSTAGVGAKRRECEGFGASDGSVMVRCRAQGDSTPLGAPWQKLARSGLCPSSVVLRRLFSAALRENFTVHNPCFSQERDGRFVMPCVPYHGTSLRPSVLPTAADLFPGRTERILRYKNYE